MVTDRDIERLYNTLSNAKQEGYNKDRLADLLLYEVKKFAKQRGTDVISLLKEINNYFLKNAKIRRTFFTTNKRWFSLIGHSRRYTTDQIIHSVAYNLATWIVYSYGIHKWVKSSGEKEIRQCVNEALQWVYDHVDYFNRKTYIAGKAKWTKISTAYTYDIKSQYVCKINIGLSGLAIESARHEYCEYVVVGKEIFIPDKAIKKKNFVCVHVAPEDICVIPWLVVAHEFAHCLADIRYGNRYVKGRRQSHDEYFIEAYRDVLREMAKTQPLINKYMGV